MKFFYIDNTQCTECNRCINMCPTGAIYISEEKRYVDYDKCTSCGSCIKSCNDNAIVFESIGQMVARMEKTVVYETRIRRLERELSLLRSRLDTAENNLEKTIRSIPVAAFAAGPDGRIITANKAMVELAGTDPLMLADMPVNLAGESITSLLPEYGRQISDTGYGETHRITTINGKAVSLAVTMLSPEAILYIARDLSDRNAAGEEVLAILRESIDRKIETVRKIGTILGDEASSEISGLNAAIKVIESGGKIKGGSDAGK